MALTGFVPIGAPTTAEGPAGDSLSSGIPTVARLVREREAARAQAQVLMQANHQLEAFLGVASHELRSPVLTSSLAVQVAAHRLNLLQDHALQQGQNTAQADQLAAVQDALMTAESSLERLSRLVSTLLDISRLQSSQLAARPAPADLLAIVRAAVDELRLLAPTRCIRLHLPSTRREIPVWADADRIHQVVTNLLTNALKYAPADLPVGVRVRVRQGWALVSVRDQGPGLPLKEHTRIWEAFHRAGGIAVTGETPHAAAQSLGLGLYITKTIIEQHHGKAGVRSSAGKGSTFWFALPVMPVMAGVRAETEDDEARWPASDAT